MNALESTLTYRLHKDENGKSFLAEFTLTRSYGGMNLEQSWETMTLSFWRLEGIVLVRIKDFDPGCLVPEDRDGYRTMDKEVAKRQWDLLRKTGWWRVA